MGFLNKLSLILEKVSDVACELKIWGDEQYEATLKRWAENASEEQLRRRIMQTSGNEKVILGKIYKKRFR